MYLITILYSQHFLNNMILTNLNVLSWKLWAVLYLRRVVVVFNESDFTTVWGSDVEFNKL